LSAWQGQDLADGVGSIGWPRSLRWRQEYGGVKTELVKRPKDLETENTRFRSTIFGPDAGQTD